MAEETTTTTTTENPPKTEETNEDVKALQDNVILTTVDSFINWSRRSSVWPLTFGLACCAIEMMAVGASKYDLDRFGSGPFRATPRQADLMVVAGTVTHKMADKVKRLYEQMPEPKYVIAMGACTINGGPYFEYGYHVVQGVDLIIPVDVYMPGCPPRPEAFLEALFRIQNLIRKEKILDRERKTTRPKVYDGTPIFHGVGEVSEEDTAAVFDEEKHKKAHESFLKSEPAKGKAKLKTEEMWKTYADDIRLPKTDDSGKVTAPAKKEEPKKEESKKEEPKKEEPKKEEAKKEEPKKETSSESSDQKSDKGGKKKKNKKKKGK